MRVLVSACLLGENCKYNGKNNYSEKLHHFLVGKEHVPVCIEMLAIGKCPRNPIEIVNDRVLDKQGNDYTEEIDKAIEQVIKDLPEIDLAVLQSRSPTCGVNQIYDGSFSGKLITGQGLFAKKLKEMNINVIDIEDLEEQ